MRIEPPPSVPSQSGRSPAATAPALPPEEPPVFLDEVEWIFRGAVEIIVAGAAKAEDGAVGLADENGAGLLHALDEHAAEVDDIVL